MIGEEWRAIPGWEGHYEASSLGRVRSLERVDSAGRRVRGRVLSPSVRRSGYLHVLLWRGGRSETRYVHRLVTLAFVGPCPETLEVCHLDGDPGNNRIENLRYDTSSANHLDAVRHGTHHNASKTHCLNGHPFDDSNTHLAPSGQRVCRACNRMRMRKGRSAA